MILTNLKPQVKGTSLVNARKYIISELGDTRYRQLCNDHKFPGLILSSSWYDMSTYVKLCHASSEKIELPPTAFYRHVALAMIQICLDV